MRKAKIKRKTKETEIEISISIDGKGKSDINTGLGFMDHMLTTFSKHSGISMKISAKGDLKVDEHHLIEDLAIVLGNAIKKALGDKKGINRFGDSILPMDEAASLIGVDVSGRGIATISTLPAGRVGGIMMHNITHFFETFCRESGINLYAEVKGKNYHHMVESLFKGFARALKCAIEITGDDIPSVKGVM
jgi:imidazoleglycerol-phosphate dehydratase